MHRRSSIGQSEKQSLWQEHEYGTTQNIFTTAGAAGVSGRSESNTINRNNMNNRSYRRYILGFLILLFSTTTILYTQFFQSQSVSIPLSEETAEMAIPEETSTAISPLETYGVNAHPAFTDIIQVKDLDTKYVPSPGKAGDKGRLVVVGDVHGMKHELIKLLEKVEFNVKKGDHLILVGDLITKGPDSLGVVDLAMSLGASAVRGNHEDRVLLAYDEMKARNIVGGLKDEGEDDDLEELSYSHGNWEDRHLAKQMNTKQIEWLKKLPVILRVGKVEGMGQVVVVHAGLVPGVELESQDTFMAMNMRTEKDGVPSDKREGRSWTKQWNRHQKSLPKSERSTVIYGHDSKRGLRIEDYSKGIDTGCRKGDKLTALVISGGKHDVKQDIIHVKCNGKHHSQEVEEEAVSEN